MTIVKHKFKVASNTSQKYPWHLSRRIMILLLLFCGIIFQVRFYFVGTTLWVYNRAGQVHLGCCMLTWLLLWFNVVPPAIASVFTGSSTNRKWAILREFLQSFQSFFRDLLVLSTDCDNRRASEAQVLRAPDGTWFCCACAHAWVCTNSRWPCITSDKFSKWALMMNKVNLDRVC